MEKETLTKEEIEELVADNSNYKFTKEEPEQEKSSKEEKKSKEIKSEK